MTIEEVKERVRLQAADRITIANDHRITLERALVPPQRITIIARSIQNGRVEDQKLNVWLVGRENPGDGYKIIMRDDGAQFGLASSGFASDKYPILVG